MRNGKIYLVPNDSYDKIYLAVKGLKTVDNNLLLSSFGSVFQTVGAAKC